MAPASLDDLLTLLSHWETCWLVLEIDSSMLKGGGTSFQQRHWVVVDPETRPLIGQPGQSTGLTAAQFKAKLAINPFAGRMPNNAYGMEREAWQHVNKVQAEIDSSIIKLRVVTWGDEHHRIYQPALPFVLDRFYGGYAFPRFNRK